MPGAQAEPNRPGWTFLTHHLRVLAYLAGHPKARQREVAAALGVTERTVFAIIADLAREGYVRRIRDGRRLRYLVDLRRPLRHPADAGVRVGEVVGLFTSPAAPTGVPARSTSMSRC
ncbi:hypothetical protein HNP84_006030 [Thermocatellispora tengchongensis]|uniref:HTH marR-type domain-containing protein n=1 Tax=Thermocatellispora tengchongensis TaxID=1073253 RepID=A0A840PC73_9ACTN|nr:winged helix-turn-helix domain-containing protein [Thermocatellispora tengchongensis]MBB5136286.1 hypothetical protein [Thermocatellispora tengchongensis]